MKTEIEKLIAEYEEYINNLKVYLKTKGLKASDRAYQKCSITRFELFILDLKDLIV